MLVRLSGLCTLSARVALLAMLVICLTCAKASLNTSETLTPRPQGYDFIAVLGSCRRLRWQQLLASEPATASILTGCCGWSNL
mmetsp:Transcript_61307/g.145983  ORF Transcript_61307/g.145983 Transcript_61307/m.145983 type:complete len:83 (-) Transcript_61307:24-272(-)